MSPVCAEVTYYEFDNGVRWNIDVLDKMLKTKLASGGRRFFKLDTRSKNIIDAIGRDVPAVKTTGLRQRVQSFARSKGYALIVAARNAATWQIAPESAHVDASTLFNTTITNSANAKRKNQQTPRTQIRAMWENMDTVTMVLPAYEDTSELSVDTFRPPTPSTAVWLPLEPNVVGHVVGLIRAHGECEEEPEHATKKRVRVFPGTSDTLDDGAVVEHDCADGDSE